MRWIQRLNCHLEEVLCAVLLSLMVIVTTCNIIARYIPGLSLAASEELVVNLFVWLVILGSVVAVKQKAHLAISLVMKKFPARFQGLFLMIHWGCIVILFSLLVYFGAIETWEEYRSGMMTYSLGLPLWLFTLALPVGSVLFLVRFSQISWQEWKTLK